jgi:hypothetical protein
MHVRWVVLMSTDFSRLLLSKEASNSNSLYRLRVVFLPVFRFLSYQINPIQPMSKRRIYDQKTN